MRAFLALAMATGMGSAAMAQDVDLTPDFQFTPQTDEQRLETFVPPPQPGTTYPTIQGGDTGEPRLYITPDTSLGGSISAGGVEGNVRFPLPE